jgi:regulator of protease activity HflC (stomatin/prohibitin superfamily)
VAAGKPCLVGTRGGKFGGSPHRLSRGVLERGLTWGNKNKAGRSSRYQVCAVLYFRVVDPNKATVQIENYLFATSQLAQTTLRSVCGQVELDTLLAEREKINARIQEILDAQTEPWGIKVSVVEVKQIDLAQQMQRAIARQAEAERERRAKVINAEGEFQAAQQLVNAARIIEQHPVALQLRYLQTLTEVATENNSTTLFPVPIDLLSPFLHRS